MQRRRRRQQLCAGRIPKVVLWLESSRGDYAVACMQVMSRDPAVALLQRRRNPTWKEERDQEITDYTPMTNGKRVELITC